MIPLTVGFLLSAPLSGMLSDKLGHRYFTVGGTLITAASFALMLAIPVDFTYWVFAMLLVINGVGSGMFASPNRAEIMNAVPADQRGVGAGMNATFMNASMVLSIGIFFSLMVVGLSHSLPSTMHSGLVAQGVPGPGGHRGLAPAADRRAVLRVPRLQPDAAAARPGRCRTCRPTTPPTSPGGASSRT